MAAPAAHPSYSYSEYVRFERESRDKHEFVAGAILAMAGGTLEHGALTAAVTGTLVAQLTGRPCRVFDSNARVRVRASGNAYYPDASVVCGRLEVDPDDELSMTNPVVLVEVLSPSTENFDRTDKLADYQRIASLTRVVHVAHDEQRIDVFTREGENWRHVSSREGDTVALAAIGCTLDVTAIYRDPLRDAR
jgi:Uma2 family endonuclease